MVLLVTPILAPCLLALVSLLVGNTDLAMCFFLSALPIAVPVCIAFSEIWEDWTIACYRADEQEWKLYKEQLEKERLEREELLRWVEKNYQTTKENEQ
ncbi:hypothetical protein BJP06_06190 [Corynebacterium sp. NML120713]|nr:hypothetical protein BJP06_06190 [Corynebacterium sp. NML120713]